jgi:hypothetical protein
MASIYRSIGLPLPAHLPLATEATRRSFAALLAIYMPLDLVIDEETAEGEPARVSRSSVCGSWGAVAGTLRYFSDRWGNPRAAIEGTQIPMDLIRAQGTRLPPELVFDPKRRPVPFALERRVVYHGFELERERETAPEPPPPEEAARLRREYQRAAKEERLAKRAVRGKGRGGRRSMKGRGRRR